jgi:hypothetical protein
MVYLANGGVEGYSRGRRGVPYGVLCAVLCGVHTLPVAMAKRSESASEAEKAQHDPHLHQDWARPQERPALAPSAPSICTKTGLATAASGCGVWPVGRHPAHICAGTRLRTAPGCGSGGSAPATACASRTPPGSPSPAQRDARWQHHVTNPCASIS